MSATDQPSEDELRAAYEAEIKRIRVEQILLEQTVTLINLGMRRTGLQPGTEDERDLGQVRIAIEGVRALLPLVEQAAPEQAGPIRDALSQLQLAFVQLGGSGEAAPSSAGEPGAGGPGSAGSPAGGSAPGGPSPEGSEPRGPAPAQDAPQGEEPKPGDPGPAQRSGRLWVPGQ